MCANCMFLICLCRMSCGVFIAVGLHSLVLVMLITGSGSACRTSVTIDLVIHTLTFIALVTRIDR